jgi:hypothetical protein
MDAPEYLTRSAKTDRIDWADSEGWTVVPYGLLGEIGSLSEVLKKFRRDKKTEMALKEEVREEIGDIIWYLFAAARRAGIREISWPSVNPTNIDVYGSLENVVGGASEIFRHKEVLRNGAERPSDQFREAVITVLTGLQEISRYTEQSLEEISDHAVAKNETYWSEPDKAAPDFDVLPDFSYPEYERLPRQFSIHFREVSDKEDKVELIISMNGVQLGDRLTDNTHGDTGYRYHDVFHMAAAAFLGWSPVFRRMLKRKRKYDPKVDETEDGARAAIIEEAVVSQVYRYGKKIKFEPVQHVDEDLIKLIMEMTTEYECSKLEGRDWKLFVTKSIEIFGQIKNGFTGNIKFDADARDFEIISD